MRINKIVEIISPAIRDVLGYEPDELIKKDNHVDISDARRKLTAYLRELGFLHRQTKELYGYKDHATTWAQYQKHCDYMSAYIFYKAEYIKFKTLADKLLQESEVLQ